MADSDVIIIGGGVAGINCARHLQKKGISYYLVEKTEALGGRIKTDHYKGFLLDHGFQVFLSAYPEAAQVLDYEALNLHAFRPGSIIRINDRFEKITDPANQPFQALGSLFSPIGTISDKFKLASLRNRIMNKSPNTIFDEDYELTTLEYLKKEGFSDKIIDRLFRPFLGGIYLDSNLSTSYKMLEFVFRMFSEGDTCLPEKGMQAIPNQLASDLYQERILLNRKVNAVENTSIKLEDGGSLNARAVVMATEAPHAAHLLGIKEIDVPFNRTSCFYFSAEKPPVDDPLLVLDGNREGPANSLAVLSNVVPSYAPAGKHLCSISVIDEANIQKPDLKDQLLRQMEDWFGRSEVKNWEHLKTYQIDYAVPPKGPKHFIKNSRNLNLKDGQFICGDHLFTASTNGALASGRHAAEQVKTWLTRS